MITSKNFRFLLLLCLLMCGRLTTSAQSSFMAVDAIANYGNRVHVIPYLENGWVAFSVDSLKMARYDACGHVKWSLKYWLPADNYGVADIIRTKDDCIAILSRMPRGNIYHYLVTKIDANGAILWSHAFGDSYYSHWPYSLDQDSKGNLMVYGNLGEVAGGIQYNAVSKISLGGTMLFTKLYNQGGVWGGAIVTSDDGVVFRTGDIFMRTDSLGNLLWSDWINVPNASFYYSPIEVADGYIIPGFQSGIGSSLTKIDFNGNPAAQQAQVSSLLYDMPRLCRLKNKPPHLLWTNDLNGDINMAVLNNDLTVQTTKSFDVASTVPLPVAADLTYTDDGQLLVCGTGDNGQALFFIKCDPVFNQSCMNADPALSFTQQSVVSMSSATAVSSYNFIATPESFTSQGLALNPVRNCNRNYSMFLRTDTTVCSGDSVRLENLSTDQFAHYQWSTGDTTAFIYAVAEDDYLLTVSDACGEVSITDTFHLAVNGISSLDLGGDQKACQDSVFLLQAPVCDSCAYLWSDGSTGDSLAVVLSGRYALTVTTNKGCSASDSVNVTFFDCTCEVWYPSAFTPNKDGNNEMFAAVQNCDLATFQIRIFNRWGQEVFESNDVKKSWDGTYNGTAVPPGVYVYMVNYKPVYTPVSTKKVFRTGTVAVIR